MKTIIYHSIRFVFLVCVALFSTTHILFSQNKLNIDGQLSLETGTISGASVKVEKNGRSAGTASVSSSGAFELDLDLNAEYTITVTQSGYITRKFKINTNVPAEAVADGLNAEALPIYLTKQFPGGPDGNQVDATLKFNQALYAFEFDKSEFASIALQKKKLDPIKAKADVEAKANADAEAKAKAEQMAKLQAEYEEQVRKAEEEEKRKKAEEALNAKYKDFITKADKALADKNYEFAKTSYQEAGKLKPNETVPPAKIKEIDNILANDAKYKTEMDKGDKAFAANDFATAKTAYQAASTLKPTEADPKTKIKACDDAIAAANKEKETKAKFDAAIAKGDKSMTSKDYVGAKAAFNEALTVKPGDATATQKLQDADTKLKEEEEKKQKEKELNDAYAAAMTKGETAFKNKSYADAKTAFTEASGLKPNEAAPKTKLAEVAAAEKAEADKLAKEKENQAKYESFIIDGDRMFGETKLEEAKKQYNEALKIKSGEAYPTSQIAKIDKLIAESNAQKAKEAEIESKYTAAMTKGEAALKSGKLQDAKTAFTEASNTKPNENAPKEKLKEVDLLLVAEADKKAKEAELQKDYDQAMANAKNDLSAKNYEAAIQGFEKAALLKPNEAEPKLKKKEAEDALKNVQALAAKEKEIQAKYDAAMAKGEQLFSSKDFAGAKLAYTEAKTAKPSESAPAAKLTEIENILKSEADAAKAQANFDAAIKKGDQALSTSNFAEARKAYTEASQYKSNDPILATKMQDLEAKEKKAADEALAKKQKEEADKLAAQEAENAKKAAEAKAAAEKAQAEAEAKALKDAEAKAEAEKQAALLAEKQKAEAEAKALKDAEAKAEAEKQAALLAEKQKAEAEAKALKDAEAKAEAEKQAALLAEKQKAEAEAKALKDAEAKAEAEKQAALLAEKQKAEAEAKALKDAEAKAEAEKQAALLAEKQKAEAEAKALKDAEAKAEAEKQAALLAEKQKAEAEAKALKDAEAKAEAEKQAALLAEKQKAEAEAKAQKDAEAKAAEEQKRLAALEAENAKKAQAEEAARKKAEEEQAKIAAEQEEARRKAQEEAKKKAEMDAKRKQQAAEFDKKFAEDEAKRAEEAAKRRKEAMELAKQLAKKSAPIENKKVIYLFAFVSGTTSSYGVVNMNDGSGNRIVSESEFKSISTQYKDIIYRE